MTEQELIKIMYNMLIELKGELEHYEPEWNYPALNKLLTEVEQTYD